MPQVMVISSEGYFYSYSIDLENGGECSLMKQYKYVIHRGPYAQADGRHLCLVFLTPATKAAIECSWWGLVLMQCRPLRGCWRHYSRPVMSTYCYDRLMTD